MTQKLIALGQSLLGGLGLVWLIVEAQAFLTNQPPMIGFGTFLLVGGVAGSTWFLFDGFMISKHLRGAIEITSNAFDSTVVVKFGDLFAQDGCKAISVNEFFDSAVDDRHVAAASLHGAMLSKYWARNGHEWDEQVARQLNGVAFTQPFSRVPPAKLKRYEVGTTAVTKTTSGEIFFCVVLTRTDPSTLQASATSEDLVRAVRGLLAKARSECSGRTLNIPLLGAGLARTGIKPNIIVDLILLGIFEECRKQKVTEVIRIIVPSTYRKRVDLSTIEKDWS